MVFAPKPKLGRPMIARALRHSKGEGPKRHHYYSRAWMANDAGKQARRGC
jgi:hypothetical protein